MFFYRWPVDEWSRQALSLWYCSPCSENSELPSSLCLIPWLEVFFSWCLPLLPPSACPIYSVLTWTHPGTFLYLDSRCLAVSLFPRWASSCLRTLFVDEWGSQWKWLPCSDLLWNLFLLNEMSSHIEVLFFWKEQIWIESCIK